ncbi:methylenetetrahydrofolate reductase [NAD(P)H] [Desulfovibrio sp. PG-178-WT-4]|uniref:Methylenetetrahydrofolate reductase n=1 Tax=Desulfovibrio porci TaxID=2605782 RepID=A0A6L5XMU2_9BACT|nr:methylenetetrahydrofolate reductase [Desulfovibrio porci]MSS28299.1 methylenetetrahydrofolate reductase [NAD(P)H] [Desulfovibrio porci]
MQIGSLIQAAKAPFFSLEFFPPSDETHLPSFYATVEQLRALTPLFVSVTYGAGGARRHNTLAVTAELARRGFTTMAHLTCVGAEPESIAAFLRELRAAGVDNVLALRGDPPMNGHWDWKDGYFQHAADLVSFTREHEPDMGIGVAAYPAPHPESPSFALDRRYTADKLRAGADFAVSQLFFDVREYEALVADLRARGLDTPVVPGILPIQSFDSLRRVLSLCGATIPGKLYLSLEEADRKGGAEAVRDAGLDFAVRQICQLLECGAPGIHLYTLNKGDLCLQIAEEVGM